MVSHTCWLSYFTLVRLWCGRTVARSIARCTVTWLPNFLGWVDYHISLAMGLRPRERFARVELRYKPRGLFSEFYGRGNVLQFANERKRCTSLSFYAYVAPLYIVSISFTRVKFTRQWKSTQSHHSGQAKQKWDSIKDALRIFNKRCVWQMLD